MHRRPLAVRRQVHARPPSRRRGLFAGAGPADPTQGSIREHCAACGRGGAAAGRLSLRIVAIDQHPGMRRRERGRAGLAVREAVSERIASPLSSRSLSVERLRVQRPFAVVQQVARLRVHGVRLRGHETRRRRSSRASRHRWRRQILAVSRLRTAE